MHVEASVTELQNWHTHWRRLLEDTPTSLLQRSTRAPEQPDVYLETCDGLGRHRCQLHVLYVQPDIRPPHHWVQVRYVFERWPLAPPGPAAAAAPAAADPMMEPPQSRLVHILRLCVPEDQLHVLSATVQAAAGPAPPLAAVEASTAAKILDAVAHIALHDGHVQDAQTLVQ